MERVRRLFVPLVAACLVIPPAVASARVEDDALQRQLGRALAVPHVAPSRSSVLAVDLTTGAPLYAHNDALPLEPASNEKLAVAFAALSLLGPTYHVPTEVLGEGQLADGVWDGDVILRGHGDPTLATRDLRRLAAQLRARGIREVTGDVVGDESAFDAARTAPGWKASFYVNECEPLSALVVDRDRFGGTISRTPALSAAARFRSVLHDAGIAVDGTFATHRASPNAVLLAGVASRPLSAIVGFMNRESDNLTAELLLKVLAAAEAGRGTTAAGGAIVLRELREAQVPVVGVRIVDGSGLSRLDRMTADALVGILRAAWTNPAVRPTLLASLPVAGVSGTLEDRMRTAPARGNVLAKTGTTSDASALSGYVKGRYAFAILQNGHPLPYWWARRAQDRFAQVLAAQ
jgi:D-alanyl-D-alanine carboxypeptidase/D-alanyl-D-alanine-endopeptidase (penicillin-binding protein 4)